MDVVLRPKLARPDLADSIELPAAEPEEGPTSGDDGLSLISAPSSRDSLSLSRDEEGQESM